MYKIRIYMIDPDRPGSAQYMFLDRDEIIPQLYRLVHEGVEDTTELEELFNRYNQRERLESLKVRSLSVSDIVVFENADAIEEGYICRSIGWKRLSGDILSKLKPKCVE